MEDREMTLNAVARDEVGSERLILRPLEPRDAPQVQRLASAREVAATTLRIPHPYPDGAAEDWIASSRAAAAGGWATSFGIFPVEETKKLLGVAGLELSPEHARAEIGYWIGLPYWGRGYATEAAGALLRHGFEALGLHRVFACHFANNPASGRVLAKIGMQYEGCSRQHIRKWDRFEDLHNYGILREEWEATVRGQPRQP